MNNILEFLAVRELATNERAQRQLGRLGLVYLGVAVVVVLSYSAFPYLT